MLLWLTGLCLAATVLLGGATHSAFVSEVVLQVLAVGLLLSALWQWADSTKADGLPWHYLAFAATALAIPIIQVVPLPGQAWSALGSSALAVIPTPDLVAPASVPAWRTLSMAPASTWASAMSLLIPFSIFLAVAQLSRASRLWLAKLVLVLGIVALILGFVQVAQGPGSSLRFYENTNPSEAVGFFANRNHFAAQLYVTLVLAAGWFIGAVRRSQAPGSMRTSLVLWLAAGLALLVAIAAGLAISRSRAGLILGLVAVAGIAVMAVQSRWTSSRSAGAHDRAERQVRIGTGPVVIGASMIAVLFAVQFGLHRFVDRFSADPLEDLRWPLAVTTFEAARASLPGGTGLGSFVPVYAMLEKRTDSFGGFANRAHNDLAEILLETGLAGGVALALLLFWLVYRSIRVWRAHRVDDHVILQRAATLIVVLLLAHSLVDYPLRTSALAAVFMFSAALLVPAPAPATSDTQDDEPDARRRVAEAYEPHPPVERGRWGADVRWPEAWRDK